MKQGEAAETRSHQIAVTITHMGIQQQLLSVHPIGRHSRHRSGDQEGQRAQSIERSEQHRIGREVVHQPPERYLLNPLARAHHERAGDQVAKIDVAEG